MQGWKPLKGEKEMEMNTKLMITFSTPGGIVILSLFPNATPNYNVGEYVSLVGDSYEIVRIHHSIFESDQGDTTIARTWIVVVPVTIGFAFDTI